MIVGCLKVIHRLGTEKAFMCKVGEYIAKEQNSLTFENNNSTDGEEVSVRLYSGESINVYRGESVKTGGSFT